MQKRGYRGYQINPNNVPRFLNPYLYIRTTLLSLYNYLCSPPFSTLSSHLRVLVGIISISFLSLSINFPHLAVAPGLFFAQFYRASLSSLPFPLIFLVNFRENTNSVVLILREFYGSITVSKYFRLEMYFVSFINRFLDPSNVECFFHGNIYLRMRIKIE